MDAPTLIGIVINLGLLTVAGLAAAFARSQAGEAKLARLDAQQARDDAADHEKRALAASEHAAEAASRTADEAKRLADAQEERNAIERAKAPTDRWRLEHVGGVRYSVTNISGGPLFIVAVYERTDANRIRPEGEDPRECVVDGESVFFICVRGFGMPAATLTVYSKNGADEEDRFVRSIS